MAKHAKDDYFTPRKSRVGSKISYLFGFGQTQPSAKQEYWGSITLKNLEQRGINELIKGADFILWVISKYCSRKAAVWKAKLNFFYWILLFFNLIQYAAGFIIAQVILYPNFKKS